MAAKSVSVWAIDIGNSSLKALRLTDQRGVVEVIGFDNIKHGKILAGSGITAEERDELTALSLRQFARQNDLGDDEIIVSVPSQNSFARFVNLPPVEPKRIPEIVRFEAAQQIPFDIDAVQWDWQLMSETAQGEKRVGIFAIKNEVVDAILDYFNAEGLPVSYIQIAPMALYNYVYYDLLQAAGSGGQSERQAIVVMDIGAENTDLVVCTPSNIWQRCIPMGGNTFTRAVADTFKLPLDKAEKLKCTAAMSKYARQIFQAMRPVFTDLAAEVQRSLGYYTGSNQGVKLTKVVAVGGGTKMRGLLKYLQQTLQMPVEIPDSFNRLGMGSEVSAAKFHDNIGDFGIVYGLGIQAMGAGRIESNLLPGSVARSIAWAAKARYFIAAACCLLVVSVLCFGRALLDRAAYQSKSDVRGRAEGVVSSARQAQERVDAERNKGLAFKAAIENNLGYFKYRDIVPSLHQTIISTLPSRRTNPEQADLYRAFSAGNVKGVVSVPRSIRKQLFVTTVAAYFTDDLESATFGDLENILMGGRRQTDKKGDDEEDEGHYGDDGYEARRGGRPKGPPMAASAGPAEAEAMAGFVVAVSGYSPYERPGQLIDPVNVEEQPENWGFVTRLSQLEAFLGEGSPFELYQRSKVEHFKLQTGEVTVDDVGMPDGIGIEQVLTSQGVGSAAKTTVERRVLLDPMTREIISKVPDLDSDGREKLDRFGKVVQKVNDRWFTVYFKMIWKDAPPRK